MNIVSIQETHSSNFGVKSAKVVTLKKGTAQMDFVIKEGIHASVSHSTGNRFEMKELTLTFLTRYPVQTLINQVSRITEAHAMYHCGFRLPQTIDSERPLSLKETVRLLKKEPSLLMAWKGMVPNFMMEEETTQ